MTHYIIGKNLDWSLILNPQYNLLIEENYFKENELFDTLKYDFKYHHVGFSENIYNIVSENTANFIKNTFNKFSNLVGTSNLIVKLEHIINSGCRIFHQDYLDLRLICTLSGPGTQYIENEYVNWEQLHTDWTDVDEINNRLINNLSKIKTLNVGDLAIMKGNNSNTEHGLMHRSFPITNISEKRLVLTISKTSPSVEA